MHLERIGCEVIDVRSDLGIAEAIQKDIRMKKTQLTAETQQSFLIVLEELLPVVTKSNSAYSFLEFFAGVFLPSEAPR